VRFALTGSVLLKQPAFARKVARLIQRGWPAAVVRRQHLEGAWGAVRQAQALGLAGNPCKRAGEIPSVSQQDGGSREGDWRFNVIPEPTATSPTELRNSRSHRLDRMTVEQAVRVMIAEEAGVRRALAGCRKQIAQGVRMIVGAFRGGGRLFYAGAGTSGRLGVLDASECPPTVRTPPDMVQGIMAGGQTALWLPAEGAEDDLEGGAQAARFRGIRRGDVVVGIAASGRTPFVWGLLHAAKRQGARTILLSFNPHLRFARGMRPDLVISPSVGPELLTGSTRLKAGTATKLVLNMFTTLSMVQLGKVVQNLMVDLNPSNTKLRDRATRILQDLSGREYAECLQALERSGWMVKKGFDLLRREGA
jgi:N-acetylmuramic acid 6-phosphate etherase